jgi:hypothetical protein
MIKFIVCLLASLTGALTVAAQDTFQLAPPLLKYNTVFFSDEVKVSIAFAQPGTAIHYTVNNNEPTEKDPVYFKEISIDKNFTTLKARSFGKGFIPSGTVQATFIKDGLPVDSAVYSPPHIQYNGTGKNTLTDNKGGIASFTNKTWLGFQSDTVTVTFFLSGKKKVGSVLFNLLQDQGSWIFFPSKAEMYAAADISSASAPSGQIIFSAEEYKEVSGCKPFVLHFNRKIKTDAVTLRLYLLKNIPDWHPGKGQPGWIFIDEVKLYK